MRGGGRGLRAGLSLGRHLVEEQAGLLAQCLASMTALLGSPYAELLWCQVRAAPAAAVPALALRGLPLPPLPPAGQMRNQAPAPPPPLHSLLRPWAPWWWAC
jgi:hypothetical protein